MKWTPKRVIALSAVGLIAWGASAATGDERGSTAPPQVADQKFTDATAPTPVAASEGPAAGTSAAVPTTTAEAESAPSPTTPAASVTATGDAASALAALPVKGRAPM